jgi:hypothetical protein
MITRRSLPLPTTIGIAAALMVVAAIIISDLVSRVAYAPATVSQRVAAAEQSEAWSGAPHRSGVRVVLPSPYLQ